MKDHKKGNIQETTDSPFVPDFRRGKFESSNCCIRVCPKCHAPFVKQPKRSCIKLPRARWFSDIHEKNAKMCSEAVFA